MANLREIRTRIESIRETLQITNAMYMISSSKLQKAKTALANTEPYFNTLQKTIEGIIHHLPEDVSDFYFDDTAETRKSDRCGYIIVTADKGLAGAYNMNVLKAAEKHLADHASSRLLVIGEVGRRYFVNKGIKIDDNFNFTVNNPSMNRARNISEQVIDMYIKNELDEINIIYTVKKNSFCETVMERLLPLHKPHFSSGNPSSPIKFYPSEIDVLHAIIPNYIAGFIYGALMESFCSEQESRMTAMQSSGDNAKKMLRELDIMYNRARQAAITQEINEVIGGAKILLKKKKQKKEGTL